MVHKVCIHNIEGKLFIGLISISITKFHFKRWRNRSRIYNTYCQMALLSRSPNLIEFGHNFFMG